MLWSHSQGFTSNFIDDLQIVFADYIGDRWQKIILGCAYICFENQRNGIPLG